jgi:ATP-dependent RNA helicase RhlE
LSFKRGTVRVLVATDLASRGLDIDQLPHVVNFELPLVAGDYVHRIGRTGRAGNQGDAISLVCTEERQQLNDIERLLRRDIPKVLIAGYEPDSAYRREPVVSRGTPFASANGPRELNRTHWRARRAPGRTQRKGFTPPRVSARETDKKTPMVAPRMSN